MSLLLIVALGGVAWVAVCALIVAMCVSAKRGDGPDATLAPPAPVVRRRRRGLSGIPYPLGPR